jgi:hypothetical protein
MRQLLSKILLAAVTAIFTAIGVRFLINPVGAASARGIVLNNGIAITTARVGFGVFPIGLAAVMFTALVSARFRVAGLRFLSGLFAFALVVRIFSVYADHSSDTRLIAVEAVILLLTIAAMRIETRRLERS